MASLQFEHVSHIYAETGAPSSGASVSGDAGSHALRDVCLSVGDGESVALIGPSGCGKSSMLLMAAGLLAPSSGEVLVNGVASRQPRQQTALILQNLGLLPWKTVEKNVDLGLRLRKVDPRERARRVADALEGVGLADCGHRYPAELSGGMRQRVAIARALALDCDLLLMDEPLSALDELLREQIQDMLLDLWQRRGHTQVIVTHSIEEGVFLGQRVVVMTPHPGRVAAVVDNPGVGQGDWRGSDAFYRRCREVRALLAGGVADA